MTDPFRVYLETNWLVAAVLPHHEWRSNALDLMRLAEDGRCELRIPCVAFVEARHVVERETQAHANALKTAAGSVSHAARNMGRQDLADLAAKLVQAEESYRLANPQAELGALSARCARFAFSHPAEEHAVLDVLRAESEMRGPDITDLYVLAAVAADRDLDPQPQAAFLSTNSKEFAVHGSSTKTPRSFYAARRLVFIDTFDLERAKRQWAKADAADWPSPREPQQDPRLQEAQRILYKLPEELREGALQALRDIVPI